MDGKRRGLALTAVSDVCQPIRHLFYVRDKIKGLQFLVDTFAEVTVLPDSPSDRKVQPTTPCLRAITYFAIPTFGQRSLTIHIVLR